MQDRVILVTGASRGLGRQIVDHYAPANRIIGLSRSGTGPEGISLVSCNLAAPADVATVADNLCRRWPDIDVLINNAAILTSTPIALMSDGDILAQVQTNLVGPMLLTKRVLKVMMRRRRGRIVNVVSMSHKLCKPGDSVYAATKAALEVFGKIVNIEAHSYGITVNNLAVSASPSGMLEQITKANPKNIRAMIPHDQFADITGISAVIDFFCADGAGDVGGQTVFLGGV